MGLGSLAVFALHGTDGMLSRDLGIYAYAGQQVADGVPPYVGVLNRAGPLAHVLPGLGVVLARLVGLDDLFGIRLLYLVFAVACVVLVHLLGRDLFGSPWAGLAAAAVVPQLLGLHRVRLRRTAREDPDAAVPAGVPAGGRRGDGG